MKRHELSAADLKRAAHAIVKERGGRVPSGIVNLVVTFDEDSDRVLGAVVYYTRQPERGDRLDQMVKV